MSGERKQSMWRRLARRTALLCALLALAWGARSSLAQVFFVREDVMRAQRMLESPAPVEGEETSETSGWLRKMLVQFPEADMDGNGVLRESEASIWHMQQVFPFPPQGHELDNLPAGVSHYTAMVPMRDGAKLPTEVFLPEGRGPWPAVLTRTNRGRIDSALDFGDPILAEGTFAFVGQDPYPPGWNWREDGRRDYRDDGYDTVEWIAAQPWCDGNVAVTGYSEAGMTSKNTLVANPPHLRACITSITAITRDPLLGRRWRGRGEGWSPPEPLAESSRSPFDEVAHELDIPMEDKTGWFDLFTQGAIDEWVAMRHTGKALLIMGSGGHGPVSPESRRPPTYSDCDIFWRKMPGFAWLTGEVDPAEVESKMIYFLMGDCTDPEAPGNVWKVTDVWPIPHTPAALYLTEDGGLQEDEPAAPRAALTYVYDPRDPVPAISCLGGGMLDQRPLADRDDILRFETDVLDEAVEITGRPSLELFVSSDAPDTMFTATLVDVYPDGFEAILLEGAQLARFHGGLDDPQKLEPGRAYRLTIPWISTAYVFDKGHKIRVHVNSSHSPRFQTHPNTWEAIASYDEAQVARNTVHVSSDHPSRLVLPVIEPGTSQDYVPEQ